MDGPLDLRLNQRSRDQCGRAPGYILPGMSLQECFMRIPTSHTVRSLPRRSQMRSAKETTWIPPQSFVRFIEKTLDFLPEKEKKETIKKTCQRTFQALRIDVNREFEVLYEFMEKLPGALKPGGRAAILTFHSGEDKLVKKALKAGYKEGIYSDYSRDVIRPSAQECAQNGRARSTKMRWAIKSE